MKEHNSLDKVINNLESQGVVIDRAKLTELQHTNSVKTVFIKVIAIIGGLLGMTMFMGFLFMLFERSLSEDVPLFIISVLLLGITYFINKSNASAIKDGLAVATFISGFALFETAIAVGDYGKVDVILASVGLILSVISLLIYRNQLIAFLASAGVLISINCLLVFKGLYVVLPIYMSLLILLTVYLFYKEEVIRCKNTLMSQMYIPVFTATFCYTLFMSVMGSTMRYFHYFNTVSVMSRVVLTLVFIGATALTVQQLMKKLQIVSVVTKGIIYALLLFFLYYVGFDYPAFAVSVLFILWSFKKQYKVGFVLSVFALIWSMGMFYYDLRMTLLIKSISLLLSGIFFLAMYWLIQKNWKKDETV
ncbi:DUF4401 domain-containing protein [Myroides phaeus]|uniref:DUF4401 domain-containing protein n=1 Tax=Myroides phaeus TaxID=702745 RepID=UPI002DB91942|nr:DUF4401 domain-containing protein [Myroides phaeus]MEC4116198.1 DUF4401 domain-containing protein [Myroides phaeus]